LAADWGANEVRRAAKEDVSVLAKHLQLHCPITALVSGLESEKGFQEFARRLGRERTLGQRIGKGFDLWAVPTVSDLAALCSEGCGAFEVFIYDLFSQKGSLGQTGNRALYSLLCRVRRYLQPRLQGILNDAYAVDSPENDHAEHILFGGCYFAAAGDVPEQQAFVRSVFEKLPQQQEDLEWCKTALRTDRLYRNLAYAFFALDLVLFAAITGCVLMRFLAS
jgi:hypothetical protein